MSMMRWQPFSELISPRQAIEKLFKDSFVTPSRILNTLGPGVATPIDMYQTANDVVVKATLPGIKPEEVDITYFSSIIQVARVLGKSGLVLNGKSQINRV